MDVSESLRSRWTRILGPLSKETRLFAHALGDRPELSSSLLVVGVPEFERSITSVSSSTTSYADTSVTGLSTTYWYEVEAVGPGGTADSNEVSSTTPVLCL